MKMPGIVLLTGFMAVAGRAAPGDAQNLPPAIRPAKTLTPPPAHLAQKQAAPPKPLDIKKNEISPRAISTAPPKPAAIGGPGQTRQGVLQPSVKHTGVINGTDMKRKP